jgi:hypothetical protein
MNEMTLHFNLTLEDALAMTQHYFRHSKVHQASLARLRWTLTIVFGGFALYIVHKGHAFSWIPTAFISGLAVIYWYFFPRMFGARILRNVRKQYSDPSHAKNFGPCDLVLSDTQLSSTSPMGSSTFFWPAVDRVTLDAEYLTIFLGGAKGYPIRIAEIGQEAAQRAYDFALERMAHSQPMKGPLPSPS